MATTVVRSSLGISSEHASAAACSALRYHISENVRILTVVVAIGKLRQVQRQIFFADLMERTDHATLRQAPEGFNIVRVNIPSHIFSSGMIHDSMWIGTTQ